MIETWAPVMGYEGYYEVSTLGQVRSINHDPRVLPYHYLKQKTGRTGYSTVNLAFISKPRTTTVHTIVARAFIGPCPIGHEVNHIDGIKSNCRLDNLEYLTRSDNAKHAVATGLWNLHNLHSGNRKGERNGRAKLTPEQVQTIRETYDAATIKYGLQSSLAREYNVTSTSIRGIVLRQCWKHI